MSKPKGDMYTFVFAGAICIFCALILSISATALKPRQEANVKLDIVVNLMSSVGIDEAEMGKLSSEDVFKRFDQDFETLLLNRENVPQNTDFMKAELETLGYPAEELGTLDTGTLLRRFNAKVSLMARKADKSAEDYDPGYKLVYKYKPGGDLKAYVIPIDGYGLWDIVKGYIALEPDLVTVKGISFYEHKETPGLGARIVEPWFKNNYKGKKIRNEKGELVSVMIAKGEAPKGNLHMVDGISGATLTGTGINQFIKEDLKNYESYFKSVQGGAQ